MAVFRRETWILECPRPCQNEICSIHWRSFTPFKNFLRIRRMFYRLLSVFLESVPTEISSSRERDEEITRRPFFEINWPNQFVSLPKLDHQRWEIIKLHCSVAFLCMQCDLFIFAMSQFTDDHRKIKTKCCDWAMQISMINISLALVSVRIWHRSNRNSTQHRPNRRKWNTCKYRIFKLFDCILFFIRITWWHGESWNSWLHFLFI